MGEKEKPNKKIWKKWWFWALIVAVIIGGVIEYTEPETEENTAITTEAATDPTETKESETEQPEEQIETEKLTTEEQKEEHIYDNAIVKDVMNGFRSEKIGEYSIIEMRSDQITIENLTDWYFNYVDKNDFNWSIILYTDKTNEGVYANAGTISKDVTFDIDEYGDYSLGDCSKCTTYAPNEKGELKELYSPVENNEISKEISIDEFLETVKISIQGSVGEGEKITGVKYENDDLYIYVDFSETDPKPLTFEELAINRTSSITDSILELSECDSLWNNIIIDFGKIGHIKNGKENIRYNEFGRYFDSANFKIE